MRRISTFRRLTTGVLAAALLTLSACASHPQADRCPCAESVDAKSKPADDDQLQTLLLLPVTLTVRAVTAPIVAIGIGIVTHGP